jgi:hypothetical protein
LYRVLEPLVLKLALLRQSSTLRWKDTEEFVILSGAKDLVGKNPIKLSVTRSFAPLRMTNSFLDYFPRFLTGTWNDKQLLRGSEAQETMRTE